MGSFFEHFATLPDPRVDRTRLHKLSDIVFIAVAAALSGCEDWNEMELYGNEKQQWLKKYLELPHGIPAHDTMWSFLKTAAPKGRVMQLKTLPLLPALRSMSSKMTNP
jgi:hypothetical protein